MLKLILVIRQKTFRFMQLLKRILIICDRSILCLLYRWLMSRDRSPPHVIAILPLWAIPIDVMHVKKIILQSFIIHNDLLFNLLKKRTCHGQCCISFLRIEVKLRHLTPRNLSFFYFIKNVHCKIFF